jgi:pilus assembly protein Flp/PilA
MDDIHSCYALLFRDITTLYKWARQKTRTGQNIADVFGYLKPGGAQTLAATLFSGGAMMISKLYFEEDGQTLVEYGLLISLLALAVIAAVTLFGKRTANMWGNNSNKYPDPPT